MDFYSPEFAHLSEQGIERVELYASGVSSENTTVFGYQGVYDEMRVKHDMVCGAIRPGQAFEQYTLARNFASAPLLNQSFLEAGSVSKRIFAAQGATDTIAIIQVGNKLHVSRPMPVKATPAGL